MPFISSGILKVRRAYDRERASGDITNGYKDTQCYKIITSDPSISSYSAMFAIDPAGNFVPQVGNQHDKNPALYVNNVTPERDRQTPLLHLCWINFDKLAATFSGNDRNNITVDGSGVEQTENVYRDLDDFPVANSASVPYDGGEPRTFYDETFNVGFNSPTVDFDTVAALRGCCNTHEIVFNIYGKRRTFEPFSLKFKNNTYSAVVSAVISAQSQNYFKNKYEFLYRKPAFFGDRPWNSKRVDQGIAWWNAVTKTKSDGTRFSEWEFQPIRDASNQPICNPMFLDGKGGALIKPGDKPWEKKAVIFPQDKDGNPVGFRMVDDKDFTPLLADLTLIDGR